MQMDAARTTTETTSETEYAAKRRTQNSPYIYKEKKEFHNEIVSITGS